MSARAPDLLWLDATSGAAGDMLLAALVDAGADLAAVRAAAAAVVPVDVDVRTEVRDGFRVARATVTARADDATSSRTWADVRALLEGADLPEAVRATAAGAFERLARAEAAVHGVEPDDVHFHEVGAHDAVGDVVGTAAAWHDLGGPRVVVSPVALGSGTARTRHGEVPVPVPAVLHLVRDAGAPVVAGPAEPGGELCTPTGAALLAALADAWGPLPAMAVTAVGLGAGTRPTPGRLGAVRAVLGRSAPADEADARPVVLETNVDDLDPRLWPVVLDRLLGVGASDAWLAPVLMKKGRPAHVLSVLCPPEVLDAVRQVVATETSAIGWREHRVDKHALDREVREVDVDGVVVRVKLARLGARVVNAQPEHDDVVAAAARLGRPAKSVLADAVAAAQGLLR